MNYVIIQKWLGRWEQLCGRLKAFWGELTGDEIRQAEGHHEQLIGLLHERTGERREQIRKRLMGW